MLAEPRSWPTLSSHPIWSLQSGRSPCSHVGTPPTCTSSPSSQSETRRKHQELPAPPSAGHHKNCRFLGQPSTFNPTLLRPRKQEYIHPCTAGQFSH